MVRRNRPYISTKSIQGALDNLVSGAPYRENPLEYLTAIDFRLSQPAFPNIENPRAFALKQLLCDLLYEELSSLRRNFGLASPALDDVREVSEEQIHFDVQLDIPDLTGCSFLYYRHVRADLDISLVGFCNIAHVDERTLRRYRTRAIQNLRDRIARHEQSARSQAHHLRLYSVLPHGLNKPHLIGREDVLNQMQNSLSGVGRFHVLVTGEMGIGKTSLVEASLHQQIQLDLLDDIVWINNPHSAAYVIHRVREQLIGDDLLLDLQQYLLHNRVAIVLDDVQDQQLIPTEALTNADVYVTSLTYLRDLDSFVHISLQRLNEKEIVAFVQHFKGHSITEEEDVRLYADELCNRIGGNPLALRLTLQSFSNLDIVAVSIGEEVAKRVVKQALLSLGSDALRVVLMFTLLPPSMVVCAADLKETWPDTGDVGNGLSQLLSTNLIESVSNNQFVLGAAIQRYAHELAVQIPGTGPIVTDLLKKINTSSFITLAIVEYILLGGRWVLDDVLRKTWLDMFGIIGPQQGRYAAWNAILQAEAALSYELRLARALCLRKLAHFNEASQLLQDIISETGRSGEFGWQGRAMIALATIFRSVGEYTWAASLLQRAESICQRWNARDLLHEIAKEQAQILIDRRQPEAALSRINALPVDIRVLAFKGDIYLALDSPMESQYLIESAIDMAQDTLYLLGRLYAKLGYVLYIQERWDDAEAALSTALLILEKNADRYALARCMMNMAVLLQQRGHPDKFEIEQLLIEVRNMQMELGDKVGLIFSNANLNRISVDLFDLTEE
jgi:tetratricopeptide (TPR) repeat protein